MKQLLVYLKTYKKETILAPLFKMLEALFELFVPLVIAAIIDTGIENKDVPYIVRMAIVLVVLAIPVHSLHSIFRQRQLSDLRQS